jgi:DNA polymerase epsilon subunit 3
MTDIDAELPKAAIKRIIKSKLAGEVPEGSTKRDVQVNKEALAAFTQATKVFISYVASAAHDICSENKRSTVVPKDVLQALGDLNFGGFIPQLEEMLQGAMCNVVQYRQMSLFEVA